MKSINVAAAVLMVACAAHAQTLIVTNNMSLWLKADAGVTTNVSGVSLWVDQSGSGNDATQSSAGAEPQWIQNVLNGNPTVRLDGVNDAMSLALGSGGIAQTADSTVYIVYKVDTTGGSTMAVLGRNYPGAAIYTGLVGPNTRPGMYWSPYFESTTNVAAWSYYRYGMNSTGPESISVLGATPTTAEISGTPTQWTSVGSGLGISQEFKGDFAEILIYNTTLSQADRQDVHEYLLSKYALPEPSTAILLGIGTFMLWQRRR